MLGFLRRLLSLCFQGKADELICKPEQQITPWMDEAGAFASIKLVTKKDPPIPEAVKRQYAKVIPNDVEIEDQGVCLTTDVAVLGDVTIRAGGTCITGNVLVFGDLIIDGKDDTTVNGTCVTGSAIVLGSVRVRGDVTVEGNAIVKGDTQIKGKLHVGGKFCHWGFVDVQPL